MRAAKRGRPEEMRFSGRTWRGAISANPRPARDWFALSLTIGAPVVRRPKFVRFR